jgi:hypothetical protein
MVVGETIARAVVAVCGTLVLARFGEAPTPAEAG